jgi:transposase-like protein
MLRPCPNPSCTFYQKNDFVRKDGSYFRKDDSRFILRFRCNSCGKRFSSASETLEFRQKKRRINQTLFKLLSSGISLRRSALILSVHPKTVERKLKYLAQKARLSHSEFLFRLRSSPVTHLQFDDLITSEHTKLKPLSVSIAVDQKRRFILGLEVSQIPAFGHLAAISRKKYGYRKSHHKEALEKLFSGLPSFTRPNLMIESDEHKFYPELVEKTFPEAEYRQFKGEKGSVAGQGELKKVYYDPLFSINHTCAMLRANVNRLIRRTWCTTKKRERLKDHLDIYVQFHNEVLLKQNFDFIK